MNNNKKNIKQKKKTTRDDNQVFPLVFVKIKVIKLKTQPYALQKSRMTESLNVFVRVLTARRQV